MDEYNVPGVIPIIPQPSATTCWAAVVTMMVSWKKQANFDIGDVMLMAGQKYKTMFDKREPLPAAERSGLLSPLGLVTEPVLSYSIDGIKNLLQSYGPISAETSAGTLNHARIISGIYGDGTPDGTYLRLIDPDPTGTGHSYSESYKQFMAVDFLLRVVHYP